MNISRSFHFVLLAAFLALVAAEEEECFGCTTKINQTIQNLREPMKGREPFKMNFMHPCPVCYMSGMHDQTLLKGVCPKDVEGKPGFIDHELPLEVGCMTFSCHCSFPTDQTEMMKEISEMMNPVGAACPAATNLKPGLIHTPNFPLTKFSPTDLLKLKSCQIPPEIPKFGKAIPTRADGLMGIKWPQFRYTNVVRGEKGKDGTETMKVALHDYNFEAVTAECGDNPDEYFQRSCKCAIESDLPRMIAVQLGKMAYPCMGDDSFEENRAMMDALSCGDIEEL